MPPSLPAPLPALLDPKPPIVITEEEKSKIVNEIGKACQGQDIAELGRLLSSDEGRACINARDRNGRTPLLISAIWSKLESVKLLVEMGADVDAVSDNYGSPLTLAMVYGYDSMVEYFLSKGASKEKAIENAHESQRIMVESFFFEYERVIESRQEFKIKREELNALMMSSEKPETLPTTCKGISIGGLRTMKAQMQSECESGRFKED
jgi:ankyrin repeat protein